MNLYERQFSKQLIIKNTHPKYEPLYNEFFTHPSNIIIHGGLDIQKYNQSLRFLHECSPSKLKYEKKMSIANDKVKCILRISDIHIEVDFATLGCNSKQTWNEIHTNIINICLTNNYKLFFVLCKNFQDIHIELYDIFYSYMQSIMHENIKIFYIINTSNISFINNNIYNRSYRICLGSPQKNLNQRQNNIYNDIYKINNRQLLNSLLDVVTSNNIDIYQFRNILYSILIYNIDINEAIWYIITGFLEKTNKKDINFNLIESLFNFYSKYNNNYRPIYHLELFFIKFKIEFSG